MHEKSYGEQVREAAALQNKAYILVRRAIERGELRPPDKCEACGACPEPGKGGRRMIEAHHHEGYDKPLSVIWLCTKCHRKKTPLPEMPGAPVFGSKNGAAALTEDGALKAVGMSRNGMAQRDIARKLGVSQRSIVRLLGGHTWSHVTGLCQRAIKVGQFGGAKLTADQCAEIKRLSGTMIQAKIAARFGVHRVTVMRVINGESWVSK